MVLCHLFNCQYKFFCFRQRWHIKILKVLVVVGIGIVFVVNSGQGTVVRMIEYKDRGIVKDDSSSWRETSLVSLVRQQALLKC